MLNNKSVFPFFLAYPGQTMRWRQHCSTAIGSELSEISDNQLERSMAQITGNRVSAMEVLRTIALMCVFRAKPQDLPASYGLFVALVGLSVVSTTLFAKLPASIIGTIGTSLTYVGLFCLATWILLRVRNRVGRWTQTICALLGTMLLMRVFTAPLAKSVPIEVQSQLHVSGASMLAMMMLVVLGIWTILIVAMIVREALEISKVSSFIITVIMLVVISLTTLELGGFAQNATFDLGR